MTDSAEPWIALIRAIGPITHKKMSMAALREACIDAGLESVKTLLATGNVLFRSTKTESEIRALLEGIINAHELHNDVFLCRPAELETILSNNPFPDQANDRPNHLLVLFMEKEAEEAAAKALTEWPGPESIHVSDRHAYIDYIEGIARSKLTPAVVERRLGQPGTARNWNTLRKLLNAANSI